MLISWLIFNSISLSWEVEKKMKQKGGLPPPADQGDFLEHDFEIVRLFLTSSKFTIKHEQSALVVTNLFEKISDPLGLFFLFHLFFVKPVQ